MVTIVKKDLAKKLRDEVPLTVELSERIISKVTADIIESICDGHSVTIRDFGTLKTVSRKETTGFNFSKKEVVVVPARTHVKFTASASLKRRVNS